MPHLNWPYVVVGASSTAVPAVVVAVLDVTVSRRVDSRADGGRAEVHAGRLHGPGRQGREVVSSRGLARPAPAPAGHTVADVRVGVAHTGRALVGVPRSVVDPADCRLQGPPRPALERLAGAQAEGEQEQHEAEERVWWKNKFCEKKERRPAEEKHFTWDPAVWPDALLKT